LKLNGTPQFLVGVDDVLILLQSENVKNSKKKIQTVLKVSMEVGLEINSEQTEHLWLPVTRMEDVMVM